MQSSNCHLLDKKYHTFGEPTARVPCQLIPSMLPSRTEPFVAVGTRDYDGTTNDTNDGMMVAAAIYYTEQPHRKDRITYYYYPSILLFIRNYKGIYCSRFRQDCLTVLLGSD